MQGELLSMVQEMDELHAERDHLQANLTETHKELLDMQQAYDLWQAEQQGDYTKVRELITVWA